MSKLLTRAWMALMLFIPCQSTLAGGECPGPEASAPQELTVYGRPPAFNTASGWELGEVVFRVPKGTLVKRCEERRIGLFGNTRLWYRIEINGKSGWVYSGELSAGSSPIAPERELRWTSLVLSEAFAQAPTSTGLPAQSTLGVFYALMFLGVLLGLVANVMFDALDRLPDNASLRGLVEAVRPKGLVKGLMVAPLCFLGFLQLGSATLPQDAVLSLIVAFCLAFQNGFFWQSVIQPRTPGRLPPATA